MSVKEPDPAKKIHTRKQNTIKTPKKRNKTRNRGANKIITQRPTGNGKRLTPAEKYAIRAEKDTGKSQSQVGREYGVDNTTVRHIWLDAKLDKSANQVQKIKKGLADDLLIAAHKGVGKVTALFDSVTDVQRAAMATGIMFDKYRLMSGESTSNQSVHVWLGLVNSVPVNSKFDQP